MFTIYPLNYQCLRLMQLTVYLFFGVIQKGTPKIYCPYIPNAKKKKKKKENSIKSSYGTFLEEEMAAHSSVLAWRVPLTEEPAVHGAAKSRT